MSNYPDGMPGPRHFTDTVHCTNPDCGNAWEARFVTDLGMTDFVDEDGAICPDCGSEGE